MKKVYCKDCRHYSHSHDDCLSPSNIILKDTYRGPVEQLILKPCSINEFNDCNDFEDIMGKLPKWLLKIYPPIG